MLGRVSITESRFLTAAALACLIGYVYVYTSVRTDSPVRSDAYSYYVYLPSWLIFHDPSLRAVADDCCGGSFPYWTAIHRARSRGWWVNSHPIGEAILISPFFIVAHALTRWSNLSPAGFSLYDVHSAGIAGLFYAVLGLWFLGRLLGRHFTRGVTVATLVVLLTGTSLFHYATFDSAWSHAFSFALVAALLERLDAWRPDRALDALVIGVIAGLIVLVRHTNAILPACFILTASVARAGVAPRDRLRLLVLASVAALLVAFPQFLLYREAAGSWVVNPYGGVGFTFDSPHLAEVLFSAQKGVFFYAPVLLLALAGLALLPPQLRIWRWPSFISLAVVTWLIASWWDWQFGASFGHRGFVDVYPILAMGLAALFSQLSLRPRARVIVAVSVAGLCALSMFQMFQYWHGVLPAADLTWQGYKDVFLKTW
jgi:hypothetical protein